MIQHATLPVTYDRPEALEQRAMDILTVAQKEGWELVSVVLVDNRTQSSTPDLNHALLFVKRTVN